jgi:hypothetical protein
LKKFIANATKVVGQGGVTKKVLEFFEYEGDAVLETNELTVNQVKQIAVKKSLDLILNQMYKKTIITRYKY